MSSRKRPTPRVRWCEVREIAISRALGIGIALAVLATGGASARPLTVSIDNRPLQAVAVMEGGRVLAPMRAVFEALGASVVYDRKAHTIRASTATHTIVLPIGSRIARVDGRAVQLDVPARIVALKTYVPLRFVSQALGAVVGYDARTGLVEVSRGAARTLTASRVDNVTPPNGAAVGSAFPPIGASLQSGPAQPGSIRLTIDGGDVTNEATFDGQTITYLPRTGFDPGWHTVAFSGIDWAGDPFERDWRFQTTLGDVQPDYASSEGVPFTFYNNGSNVYRVGDVMHFTLVAPPGGSAYLQLC
ncbi:MAG: copper amine oxidase N-terminal domain-containing protein, partial [Candidatus Eremiobacteraeota bacterium]|nr:copper amine oxidase N-terminal domain-containing protein [Candidatus Eremiobacteraeota bacterium]